ncbi:MAG: hypothetical protein JO254_16580 [Pseudolabrys sp.]|nr:hypothetical protein [Pseudolabrys sp.]
MKQVLSRLARIAFLVAALASPAFAAEIDDFNAAIEQASAHNRVAIGYLRTGNIDLASLEIERLRDAWAPVASRFGKPFGPFAAHAQLYVNTMVEVQTRLAAAQIMITTGRPDNARDSLTGIRAGLSTLRKTAGVPVLADCIGDSNDAMDAFYTFNDRELDLAKTELASEVAKAATNYSNILDRCDQMATQDVRQNPEFRRLIDGAKVGLALVPETIAARDAGRLHRILIELRSFDNLLAFRFG